ncbi:MAG: hypothetical protein CMM05_05480 [Rhodopirellula sp.]|nr:hypothetical protein [Rhodopirellula sp.]
MVCEFCVAAHPTRHCLKFFSHVHSCYEGHRESDGPSDNSLPLGSWMLSIADAFDSMTMDSFYRRAMIWSSDMAEKIFFYWQPTAIMHRQPDEQKISAKHWRTLRLQVWAVTPSLPALGSQNSSRRYA